MNAFLANHGLPDVDAAFALQLIACVAAALTVVWLAIGVWQKIFPKPTPPYHALATKAELEELRVEVNVKLEEMKARANERGERNAEKLTEILVSLGEIRTAMLAQHEFAKNSFENIHEKIKREAKCAHHRIDGLEEELKR